VGAAYVQADNVADLINRIEAGTFWFYFGD
jgi:hypothetical protein